MVRKTRQRDAIRTVMEKAARPLGPEEIHRAAKRLVPSLGLATVYRRLKKLVADAGVMPVQLPGQPPRYELSAAAAHHHHHFQCDTCERVYDVEGCLPGIAQLAPPSFNLKSHEIVLYGTCASCS